MSVCARLVSSLLLSLAFGLVVSVVGAFAASTAEATPIGPTCGTCQGGIYTLSYEGAPISTTATTETFRITLTIDATGYTGSATHLEEAAIKVSSSIVSASVVSGPGVVPWWMVQGGLNADGCSGAGSGFDCVGLGSGGILLTALPIFGFTFDIEVATGGLFTGLYESSIKARYTDGAGNKVGDLVSENITLMVIPEPSTALLLALGLGLGAATRRRR